MKVAVFNRFLNACKEKPVHENTALQCMGYMWLDLTDKQLEKVKVVLAEQNCPIETNPQGKPAYHFGMWYIEVE